MVGAHEGRHAPGVGLADHHAAVRAAVVEHARRAGVVAHQDDGVRAHVARDVVARLRNLAFETHEQPRAREQVFDLQIEHRRVGVQAPAGESFFGVYQGGRGGRREPVRCGHA